MTVSAGRADRSSRGGPVIRVTAAVVEVATTVAVRDWQGRITFKESHRHAQQAFQGASYSLSGKDK